MYIWQIFGAYRAEFECKKGSLIRRLYMQNAVVFNTYCTYISRILGINLVHTIEAAERLDIWLDSTNLYISTGLLTLKKGYLKTRDIQIPVMLGMVLHRAFPNRDFGKILQWEHD